MINGGWTKEDFEKFYSNYPEEQAIYSRRWKRLREHGFGEGGGSVLVGGCGAGGLVVAAREDGFEASGMDLSEYAQSIAGIEILIGDLRDLDPDSYRWVVTEFVLECYADDDELREVVRACRRAAGSGDRSFHTVLIDAVGDGGGLTFRNASDWDRLVGRDGVIVDLEGVR